MSSIQERLQLKRVPLDTWNIREQLCLASAVVRSGDQNWMSVSRALKTVGEPSRPSDWYSQKSCAAQYGALLENVETPKRKKRNSEGAVETPQENILKKLTQERIVEIQKTVAELTQQYELVKNELLEVREPSTSEERLKEMWTTLETAKRNRERENARRAAWLKEREEKSARAERAWKPSTPPTQQPGTASPAPPSSPLLTSLLKSSPVVTTPQSISHPANIIETVSPSAGAPTLSMLLEKPGSVSITQPPITTPTTTVEQQESKHAAIEHIKNQLVQIEQQLIASTSASPVPLAPVPAPAPAIEIDDIEIKAEDVYAFRDIDIHIPPVTTMHKGAPRSVEKSIYKKGDEELDHDVTSEDAVVEIVDDIKEESMETTAETEDALHTEPESAAEETSIQEESATVPEIIETNLETEPRISFPEVKFPTPEIKVIQPDERKVKEEIKEPDVPPQIPEKETVEEVQIDENVTANAEKEREETPEVTEIASEIKQQIDIEEKPVATDDVLPPEKEVPAVNYPENIPLPPEFPHTVVDDVCVSEVPLPPTSDISSLQEIEQTKENLNTNADETELIEPKDLGLDMPVKLEQIKKENIEETLSKMMKEEVETEVKPEGSQELEETHTETDDDTPMELSREEDRDGKKKRDYSRKKKPDSRTCSGSESAAEASAPDSPSANDAERQHRLWRKSVMLVYSRLCAHKYASLFLRPISDEEAPGYSVVIKRPMDLSTIKRNIDSGVIRTTAQFQRDVLLMLSNALMYNSSEHSVYQMAKDMHEEAECQLGMLLAAQAHAGLQCGAPPVAATRKRRRADSPYQPSSKRHNY